MGFWVTPSKTGKNFNKLLIIAIAVILTIVVTVFIWKPEIGMPERGVWDGRTYTDSETGISLTVPDDWQIMSDADIIESFQYSSNIYEDPQSYSNYVDACIYKVGGSQMYIEYYSSRTVPETAEEQAGETRDGLGSLITYNGIQYSVVAGDITAVEIGGLTYERVAYALSGMDGVEFIQYYRCLEGESGEIFAVLNLRVLNGTTEDEILAMFSQL